MVEGMPAGAKFYILVASAKTANHSIFSCGDRVQLPHLFLYAVTEVASDFHEISKNCLDPQPFLWRKVYFRSMDLGITLWHHAAEKVLNNFSKAFSRPRHSKLSSPYTYFGLI